VVVECLSVSNFWLEANHGGSISAVCNGNSAAVDLLGTKQDPYTDKEGPSSELSTCGSDLFNEALKD
jgi:hypothetical protein